MICKRPPAQAESSPNASMHRGSVSIAMNALSRAGEQRTAQPARPRPDFENRLPRKVAGKRHDAVEKIAIQQKMLTEALVGT